MENNMLNVLDKFLENLFAYGIPLVFTLWAVGFTGIALINLFSDASLFDRAELLGLAVCHACACWWFWVWKAQMVANGVTEGYSHVPAFIAFFIAAIVIAVPSFLRGIFIPYCVTAAIYVGIIIFGL
jgi:threonine/homoserine efflux transporter RhtA